MRTSRELPYQETGVTMHLGWAKFTQGDEAGGFADMRSAIAQCVAARSMTRLQMYLPQLVEACVRRGRIPEAQDAVDQALSLGERCGANHWLAELLRLRGVLALARDGPDAVSRAEAAFLESLDVARRQSAKSLELRTATSLARLHHRRGEPERAHALLAPLLGWFAEGHNTRDLQEAAALLDACSTRARRERRVSRRFCRL